MPAEMHCHTNRSDGSDSPEFVIRLAKQMGLSALAITDHDSYAGDYDAEGLGRSLGMRVINGVECSTFDNQRGHKVHILCYNIKHPDAVRELLDRITRNRAEATLAMLEKASRLYPITEEMVREGVSDSGYMGKQHIVLALMKAGYTNEMYGELYRKLFNRRTGSCFVPVRQVDSLEAMSYLRESGGVIVMAHPSVYNSITTLGDLIRAGIHGIELYHPRNTQEHMAVIRQAAADNGLLLTGGTDFHGYFSEEIQRHPLGSFTATDEMLARFDELSSKLK
ncbi:MAG: PHP domain-containing protein [Clostridia bacterium]|nr:PHP domain-containing protein [Clostridia bacterium]